MGRRERSARVSLDHLTDDQMEIVRSAVWCALVGQAADLRVLHSHPEPKAAIKEVAALGRLAFWLEHGQVLVPDPIARRFAGVLAEGADARNAEIIERYEEAVVESEALHLLAAAFDRRGVDLDA
jgi:hypothetical protein